MKLAGKVPYFPRDIVLFPLALAIFKRQSQVLTRFEYTHVLGTTCRTFRLSDGSRRQTHALDLTRECIL